jgi:transposase
MNIKTLGIDLSKNVFQLHGVDAAGKAVLKRKLSREKLTECIATLPLCEVVMEACGGANYWARQFKQAGHEVKLISPQFVKPFVKGNKNDSNDAMAIVEAASRPSMRYVSPKSAEQQDMQSLLRLRDACIKTRTQMSNQIRGLLAEYGIVFSKKMKNLRAMLPKYCDKLLDNGLSDFFKTLLEKQYELFIQIDEQIAFYEEQVKKIVNSSDTCQRLMKIEGVGPITSLSLITTIGDPNVFKNGRHFAAFVGLVPKQHSSGSRERLLGISKRGDNYLRQMLIHGARAVVSQLREKTDTRSQWIRALKERRSHNVTVVALANKNARIALAILKNNEEYLQAA